MSEESIQVTSHVARDLLSSAAPFRTDASVVWEYVSNSLQYVSPGVAPKVLIKVFPRKQVIEIHDNGRGMDRKMLGVFFTMHAENVDRLRGRPGRGKFGTGKAAAFGIANTLRVETRQGGLLNIVELTRQDIQKSNGHQIPVREVVVNEPTTDPDGTSIVISDIHIAKIREASIIEYLERHLQVYRQQSPEVAVNDHICEFRPPEISETKLFEPSDEQRQVIGDVILKIFVSKVPLSREFLGISVTAGIGNLVGIEDCGVCSKEHGNYLFGEIDAPAIETYQTPIEPFDDSRSLQLNQEHPVVLVLLPFIGANLESVRKELVREYKAEKKTEEARQLAETANQIADVLNDDFNKVKNLLNDIRSSTSKKGSATSMFGSDGGGDEEQDVWIEGLDKPGELEKKETNPNPQPPDPDPNPRPDPKIPETGTPDDLGDDVVSPAGGEGKKRKPRGGFSVAFQNLGIDEERSKYDENTLTIIVNKDFPAVAAALESTGTEDPVFLRLAYEIAITEYAMAWGMEKVKQDPDMIADDLRFDIRSTLQRVSRSAAHLYRSIA